MKQPRWSQSIRILAVVLATVLAFAAMPLGTADADGRAPDSTTSKRTIAELAVNRPRLSTLVTALSVASDAGPVDFIAAASDPNADLTVFAPTNRAFNALGADTLNAVLADPSGLLTDILSYHVLGTSESSTELGLAGTATTLLGEDVTITADPSGAVFINDALVKVADIKASNGVIHIIDAVLLPPEPEPKPGTIAEIAVATPELSTLVTALTVATDAGTFDFLGAASNPDADLTVFAPTNAAFDALGPDTLNAVLADPGGLLTDILSYHVLGTSETGTDLVNAGTATTLLGQDVTITVNNGNVFINDSQVVIADIEASNGIVHVIDAVLLPAASDPVFDGANVQIISADSGRYLDGDNWRGNIDVNTSFRAKLDDHWTLEATGNGTWQILNARIGLYLDADGGPRYNVDLAAASQLGTEWEITKLDNGHYELRSVSFDRLLDYDTNNVDTAVQPRLDREWVIVLNG